MSASTETAPARTPRNHGASQEPKANGADTVAAAPAVLGNVTIEIAGNEITLPVKFGPGHILTENQAKVLDAAYQRQFTNNQNALAKSRAEKLTDAKTDDEKGKYQPLTATALAALYADYEPSVGGTPRQSMMEKIRMDAAWRFWTGNVKAHNDSVAAGGPPVIAKAGNKTVDLPTGKGSPEKREALQKALLNLPSYADRIQTHIDAIMAERGTPKAAAKTDDSVSLSADDLM